MEEEQILFLENRRREVEASLEAAEHEIVDLKADNAHLKELFIAEQAHSNELQVANTELHRTVSTLTQRCDDLQAQVQQQQQQQGKSSEDEVGVLREENKRLQERLAKMRAAQAMITDLDAVLQKKLQECETERDLLAATVASLRQNADGSPRTAAATSAGTATAAAAVAAAAEVRAREEIGRLEKELASARHDVSQMDLQTAALRRDKEELSQTIATLRSSLSKAGTLEAQLREQIHQLRTENTMLAEKNIEMTTAKMVTASGSLRGKGAADPSGSSAAPIHGAAAPDVGAKDEELLTLRKEIEMLEKKNQVLTKALVTLKDTNTRREGETKQEVEQLRQQTQQLQTQVQQMQELQLTLKKTSLVGAIVYSSMSTNNSPSVVADSSLQQQQQQQHQHQHQPLTPIVREKFERPPAQPRAVHIPEMAVLFSESFEGASNAGRSPPLTQQAPRFAAAAAVESAGGSSNSSNTLNQLQNALYKAQSTAGTATEIASTESSPRPLMVHPGLSKSSSTLSITGAPAAVVVTTSLSGQLSQRQSLSPTRSIVIRQQQQDQWALEHERESLHMERLTLNYLEEKNKQLSASPKQSPRPAPAPSQESSQEKQEKRSEQDKVPKEQEDKQNPQKQQAPSSDLPSFPPLPPVQNPQQKQPQLPKSQFLHLDQHPAPVRGRNFTRNSQLHGSVSSVVARASPSPRPAPEQEPAPSFYIPTGVRRTSSSVPPLPSGFFIPNTANNRTPSPRIGALAPSSSMLLPSAEHLKLFAYNPVQTGNPINRSGYVSAALPPLPFPPKGTHIVYPMKE